MPKVDVGIPVCAMAGTPMFGGGGGAGKIAALSQSITINGSAVDALGYWLAKDAELTSWQDLGTVGTDLSYDNNSNPPTLGQSGLFGGADKYLELSGSTPDYYKEGSAGTNYNPGTHDMVLEAWVRHAGGANEGVFGKRAGSGGGNDGWLLYFNSSTQVTVLLEIGAAQATVQSATLSADTAVHILAVIDRDEASTNGSRVYANGSRTGATGVDMSGAAASINPSTVLGIGARAGSDSLLWTGGKIVQCAVWTKASWFAGGAQNLTDWDAFAAARYAAGT